MFSLKELSQYTKSLRPPEKSFYKFNEPLLGDKYKEKFEYFAPIKFDWADTPIYKQYVLRQSLMESLKGQVVFENYKAKIKNQKIDLKAKAKK